MNYPSQESHYELLQTSTEMYITSSCGFWAGVNTWLLARLIDYSAQGLVKVSFLSFSFFKLFIYQT